MKLNNKGFGVISLLVFLIAIGLLTVMVIPTISQNMTNNQVTSAESTILALQSDVSSFTSNGGSLSSLGIGSAPTPPPYGLQSVTYKYLVPVSWTPNTTLNTSYVNLTTQNGWYNVPNGSFATAYLVTTGSNVFTNATLFTGATPAQMVPQFAVGIYAPTMTNAQVATIVSYIETKEPTGSFGAFIWNGNTYVWNATNKDFETSTGATLSSLPGNATGNGQLIFGYDGYLSSSGSVSTSAFTYTVPDPMIYTVPGQYQFQLPTPDVTITVAGGDGGPSSATNGDGGYGGTNSYSLNASNGLSSGAMLVVYVGGRGGYNMGAAGGYGGYGGYAGGAGGADDEASAAGAGGGGASSVWLNGKALICAGGGGGAGGAGAPGGNGGYAGGAGGAGSTADEASAGGGGGSCGGPGGTGGGVGGSGGTGGAGAGIPGLIGLNFGLSNNNGGNETITGNLSSTNTNTDLIVSKQYTAGNGWVEISW